MDWIVQVSDGCIQTALWLAGMAVAFAVLTRIMPCNIGMYWWKDPRALATDLLYWFVTPVALRSLRTMLVSLGLTLLWQGGRPGFAVIRELPVWAQCLGVLILQDVMLYWIHRGFHSKVVWKFHAVHHSPVNLDWLSAARFHVVNQIASFVFADVVAIMLGFSVEAMLLLVPFNLVYSGMVHANLNWTFGPLRYVFASPVFHRWHHVAEGEGVDKNFASTFPILDLIFGTYYMPVGVLPQNFGVGEPNFPEDFFGQLLYPFAQGKPTEQATPTEAASPPAINGPMGISAYANSAK